MGIYDREYYRGETTGSHWFNGIAPVCKTLIAINVAVFVLEMVLHWNFGDRDFAGRFLAASPEYTLRHLYLWELVSATFLHADIWHLFGNMLFLWVVGREMEAIYGSRDFLAFYLCAAVVSTLGWVLFDASSAPAGEFHDVIGASGAVMGVVTLFTLFYPKREMLFIIVPMPMWVVLAIYLFFPLLPQAQAFLHDVAVESHLAGAAFGVIYWYFDLRWSRLFSVRNFRPRLRIFSPVSYDQGRPRTSGSSPHLDQRRRWREEPVGLGFARGAARRPAR